MYFTLVLIYSKMPFMIPIFPIRHYFLYIPLLYFENTSFKVDS